MATGLIPVLLGLYLYYCTYTCIAGLIPVLMDLYLYQYQYHWHWIGLYRYQQAHTCTIGHNLHIHLQEVIRSALISGNLPLAHAYLIQKSKDDDEESSPSTYHTSSYDVTLNSLMSVGVGFAMEALAKMNMKQGIMFLSQMVCCCLS